ncbi:hypothetical protein GCM10018790_66450 [Kitasatospora xanthocidica]|nr:hypothetical protein GCM10018790_66450 [Kitasatospora xanthocidica]
MALSIRQDRGPYVLGATARPSGGISTGPPTLRRAETGRGLVLRQIRSVHFARGHAFLGVPCEFPEIGNMRNIGSHSIVGLA